MELVEKFDNKRRSLNRHAERFDEVDGEYRLSMHVWIRNSEGKFLIQKRTIFKKLYPGMWSITGGGVDLGETTYDTVFRECSEELGYLVDANNLEYMMSIKRDVDIVDIYLLKADVDLKDIIMQEEEVSEVSWATLDDIRKMLDNNEFAPSISLYFECLCKLPGFRL